MDGLLLLDKPAGISSAGLLNRLKRLFPRGTKLGHAGTLDPFATGLLIALVGRATKQCEALMGQPKTYITTVKLGATTPTLDPESPEQLVPGPIPRDAEVRQALAAFSGTILQAPPAFSAMKVAGRRAYELARQGVAVDLPARAVQVYTMHLTAYGWPYATVEMQVGRGFYVRSLARDLGAALGSAGYLTALRRTQVGPHDVRDAAAPDALMPETMSAQLRDPSAG